MANKFAPRRPTNLIDEATPAEQSIESEDIEGVDKTEQESMTYSDQQPDQPNVQFNDSDSGKSPVHNVRVRTVCDHRCCIGGKWYDFKKGVSQNVPDNVKSVLLAAGLLMPL